MLVCLAGELVLCSILVGSKNGDWPICPMKSRTHRASKAWLLNLLNQQECRNKPWTVQWIPVIHCRPMWLSMAISTSLYSLVLYGAMVVMWWGVCRGRPRPFPVHCHEGRLVLQASALVVALASSNTSCQPVPKYQTMSCSFPAISCSRFHMFHHVSTSTFYGALDFDVEWCRYLKCNNWSTSSSKGHRLVLRRLDVDRHRQFGTGQTIHGLLQAGRVHRETSASPPVILLGRMADQPQIILQPEHGQLISSKNSRD